jgi:alpha-beta hydrolase superfamily lysophospholipase
MRAFGKFLGRVLLTLLVGLTLAVFLAPSDKADLSLRFDASGLPDDLDAYLTAQEAAFTDIVPGTEKQIHWAGAVGARTPLSVIYLHGFSASAQEIRPVPEDVAKALGANLYFTRLAGHGRTGAAMATATANDWILDMGEALAIGRRLGERVLVIATSTGGTLAALMSVQPDLALDVAGAVFISPNFGFGSVAETLLSLPLVRYWGPFVVGAERSFTPANDLQARYWTTTYPTIATIPMAAVVRAAQAQDYTQAVVPAFFLYSPEDQVVQPARTDAVVAAWGDAVRVLHPDFGDGDDPRRHLITGDVMSPNQTASTVAAIVEWAKGL